MRCTKGRCQSPAPGLVIALPSHVSRACALQLYEPFYADFGPLNLGKTHRFCEHTKQLLQVRGWPTRVGTVSWQLCACVP